MAGVTVLPSDPAAERDLAAVACLSPAGATAAASVLADIIDGWVRAVILAAVDVDQAGPLTDQLRLEAIAATADVPLGLIDEWMAGCVTMWDSGGRLRARVIAAADKRRRALQLALELELLLGAPVTFGAPA